jgi:hypothetical protein
MIRNQPLIFEVPTEILLKIYTLVIGTCSATQQHFDIYRLGKNPIALDLLLADRKIYAEARLLPFQLTIFNFNQWYGAGFQYWNSSLRRIREYPFIFMKYLWPPSSSADARSAVPVVRARELTALIMSLDARLRTYCLVRSRSTVVWEIPSSPNMQR